MKKGGRSGEEENLFLQYKKNWSQGERGIKRKNGFSAKEGIICVGKH